MIRLSKIADYGVVLMAHLASHRASRRPNGTPGADGLAGATAEPLTHNARELAAEANLPVPVVSKVLKSLARAQLLESQRGAKGGYQLARDPGEISVADVVRALEGPIALTECNLGPHSCEHELACALRSPWQKINRVVQSTLARVTLADLIDPTYAPTAPAPERGRRLPMAEKEH